MSVSVEAENMPAPGAGFSAQVEKIDALKVLVRALSVWSKKFNCSVSLSFSTSPSTDGVAINLGLPPSATPPMADAVLAILADVERMSHLELLVDQMRNAGVGPEVLDPMIDEAQSLASRLFPRPNE